MLEVSKLQQKPRPIPGEGLVHLCVIRDLAALLNTAARKTAMTNMADTSAHWLKSWTDTPTARGILGGNFKAQNKRKFHFFLPCLVVGEHLGLRPLRGTSQQQRWSPTLGCVPQRAPALGLTLRAVHRGKFLGPRGAGSLRSRDPHVKLPLHNHIWSDLAVHPRSQEKESCAKQWRS